MFNGYAADEFLVATRAGDETRSAPPEIGEIH
jgi:hypothetical protein